MGGKSVRISIIMVVVNIITTYNEAENIKEMLTALKKVGLRNKKYKFLTLVVDDKSPDGTGTIVQEFMEKDERVYLLSGDKKGLGEAMIRGLNYAIKKLKAGIVIPNEADFAFDPNYITPSLRKIEEGYDVIVGSRHVREGNTQGWTFIRRINHWVANTVFATWVAGVTQIHDHNGEFRVVRVKGILDNMDFTNFPRGFGFFCYWLFKMTQKTNRVYELPITYKFRTKGESKVSFNPKYLRIYLHDVWEYISLSFKIRLEKSKISL